MAFTGTLDKCKACDKIVYFNDLLSADTVTYHKTCFKCSHCHGILAISHYSSMDGVLYCKPHFEQLFKETGSFHKNFPGKTSEQPREPNKFSHFFSGTQDKCLVCQKTVYPLEKLTVEGEFYHSKCFKCAHGGCQLTTSSYSALNGILYCKPHFAQLFKEKGDYNHVIQTATRKRKAESPAPESQPEQEQTDEQT